MGCDKKLHFFGNEKPHRKQSKFPECAKAPRIRRTLSGGKTDNPEGKYEGLQKNIG